MTSQSPSPNLTAAASSVRSEAQARIAQFKAEQERALGEFIRAQHAALADFLIRMQRAQDANALNRAIVGGK